MKWLNLKFINVCFSLYSTFARTWFSPSTRDLECIKRTKKITCRFIYKAEVMSNKKAWIESEICNKKYKISNNKLIRYACKSKDQRKEIDRKVLVNNATGKNRIRCPAVGESYKKKKQQDCSFLRRLQMGPLISQLLSIIKANNRSN